MKKWECERKKDKWNTYYKIVFTSGITINKAGGGFESRIGFVEFIDNSKAYATVKVLNR